MKQQLSFPKYQLNLTTENNETYHIIDCWIDKFEFEKRKFKNIRSVTFCVMTYSN